MSTLHFSPDSYAAPTAEFCTPPPTDDPPAIDMQEFMPIDNPPLTEATLFIDNLMKRFNLSPEQREDLCGLYELGTLLQNPLGRADVMSRLYTMACQYGIEQRQLSRNTLPNRADSGLSDMKKLIDELKVRLDDSFEVSADQKRHLRMLCQELIYKPTRLSYKNLFLDVDKKMRARPETYKMTNIFGQLTRERKWASEARRVASNTRNSFRQEIRDSIIGKKTSSLQSFTADRIARYRPGSSSSSGEQGQLIRNVILRRFAWENKSLLGKEEHNSDDSDEDGTTTNVVEGGPAKKRKKVTVSRGRVAHGEDFWAKVDEWLSEKITLWGSDFSGANWKVYVDESLASDNTRYLAKTQSNRAAEHFNSLSSSSTLPQPIHPQPSPNPPLQASSSASSSQMNQSADSGPTSTRSFVSSFLQEIGQNKL